MSRRSFSVCAAFWLFAAAASGQQPQPTGNPGDPSTPESAEAWREFKVAPQVADSFDSPVPSSIWNRPLLTGDWFGHRTCLQDAGVTFAARVTQFGFGIDGGINAPVPAPLGMGDSTAYTGRGEYDMILDLEKFGWLPKGRLLIRAEHWYGQYGNVSLRTGSLAVPVFPAALPPAPNDPGVPFLTNFFYTQPLSENLVVYAGKKDVLGGADQNVFAGGDGTDQFMNQAFIANPAFLLAMPYTSFTAGFLIPTKWGAIGAYVYDPQNRTKDYFRFDTLFSKGIILGGEVKVRTKLMGKPGDVHVGGIYKKLDQTDLQFNRRPPGEYPYTATPGFATLEHAYTIYTGFDQYLKVYSDSPTRGWGIFGRASISDGNPNPVHYFLSLGIGGNSPVRTERGDTFGLGWYYVGASTEYGPLPRALIDPRDGTGVELYYNFQLTPWLNVTPDIQFIRPGARAISDDAFVYGLRVNMRF